MWVISDLILRSSVCGTGGPSPGSPPLGLSHPFGEGSGLPAVCWCPQQHHPAAAEAWQL
jgi:hypothetical protein